MSIGKWKMVVAVALTFDALAGGVGAILCGPLAYSSSEGDRGRVATGDVFRNPLPSGAIVRLGTSRFRHGQQITALVFSPDGETLVSASLKSVRLWDVATGKVLRQLDEGPGLLIPSVAFSPDGGKLVCLSRADVVRIHDVLSRKLLQQIQEQDHPAQSVRWSPDMA